MYKIIGGLLVAWGVFDFALSWMGIDLYAEIGIPIPAAIWWYTAYIVGGIGAVVIAVGQQQDVTAMEDDTTEDDT